MKRRGFFSRLAGVALLPALARFAPPEPRAQLMWVSLDETTDGKLMWHGEWTDGYSCDIPATRTDVIPADLVRVIFAQKRDCTPPAPITWVPLSQMTEEMTHSRLEADGRIHRI